MSPELQEKLYKIFYNFFMRLFSTIPFRLIILPIGTLIFLILKGIYTFIYVFIESYVIFFSYLYRRGLWDLITVLKFFFWLFKILLRFLIIFILKRLINLKIYILDAFEVLPFFFKHPDLFTEYNMTLTRQQKRKQKGRRARFNIFCFFILLSLFLIFFYDISDDYYFLAIYDHHKWW